MANEVRLQSPDGKHPVDENLRPIKVGGNSTALEVAQNGNGARITGGLEVSGAGKSIVAEPLITNSIISTDLTIDDSSDITLDAGGESIILKGSDGDGLSFTNHHTGSWDMINNTQDSAIYFKINDGGSVGVQVMTIQGAEPYIGFNHAGVGFSRKQATFDATNTTIDFRTGNKFRLEITGDITNVKLTFPSVSGNFLLVCDIAAGGGGDHDVTNWLAYESDGTAATTANVMWAGGSVPAFTSGAAVDIVSFYWDADEQQAYGVASLAFATP